MSSYRAQQFFKLKRLGQFVDRACVGQRFKAYGAL
jgi:hypothetical protein